MSPCQLACLAFALLVTFTTAEALIPHNKSPTAFTSYRGGESRAKPRTKRNVLMGDETMGAGDDQTVNGSSETLEKQQQQRFKQIRVTAKGGLAATRMPPKLPNGVNGINGHKQRYMNENISASAIAGLCEVEDRPIPAEFVAETSLPTEEGQFRLRAYRTEASANGNEYTGREPTVIYAADKSPFGVEGELKQNVHVRIHDQCLTSEVFGSKR